MTHKQIMAWAAQWHYPFLAIGYEANPPTREVLRHGVEHYEALRHERRRRLLTASRIERWNARLTRAQVDSAIERVDEALAQQNKYDIIKQIEEGIQV